MHWHSFRTQEREASEQSAWSQQPSLGAQTPPPQSSSPSVQFFGAFELPAVGPRDSSPSVPPRSPSPALRVAVPAPPPWPALKPPFFTVKSPESTEQCGRKRGATSNEAKRATLLESRAMLGGIEDHRPGSKRNLWRLREPARRRLGRGENDTGPRLRSFPEGGNKALYGRESDLLLPGVSRARLVLLPHDLRGELFLLKRASGYVPCITDRSELV